MIEAVISAFISSLTPYDIGAIVLVYPMMVLWHEALFCLLFCLVGNMERSSPCTVGTLAGMLGVGSDQDWIDLTDLATPTHQPGNPLLAA